MNIMSNHCICSANFYSLQKAGLTFFEVTFFFFTSHYPFLSLSFFTLILIENYLFCVSLAIISL